MLLLILLLLFLLFVAGGIFVSKFVFILAVALILVYFFARH